MKRRDFVRRTTLSAGALVIPTIIPRKVFAAADRPGANDRIALGIIGPGGRAHSLLSEAPNDIQLVALADCDLRQMEAYEAWAQKECPNLISGKLARYQDYRQMFDKQKLDAVIIATTTHARALICIDAMRAGLDVYAEKPLTLTIEEGWYLMEAEKKYKTVFQVGTQQRSVPIDNYGSDLVRNGAIGKVHTVLAENFIGPSPRPPMEAEPVPEGLNWDMWLHQTDEIPYTSQLHPSLAKWGTWRPYDGGGQSHGVTGWGAHAFDQVQRALGTDHTTPVEVWLEEDPSPTAKVSLRYQDGPVMKLELPQETAPGLGAIFIGEKGKIEINRNRVVSDPPEIAAMAPTPDDTNVLASVADRHLKNWVECIRTREKPNAPAEVGHRSSVICHLINICRELGRTVKWDPEKEEFIGDEEANSLRSRARRKGYELPKVA